MSRRAVVTGGAGFLGSHLCGRLLADGWDVECVDNLATGRIENVAGFAESPAFSLRQADVSKELESSPTNLSVLFHLACPASPTQYARLPVETLEVSAFGTARALELAGRAGATMVLASTSEVYGDPLEHPQSESYWGNVDPVGPRSMYDEGKRFAEALATWHARTRGVDVRIARIFNTYGPRMGLRDGRVVPTLVRQALVGQPLTVHGEGEQTRSFCYVSDLVDGLVRLSSSGLEVGPGPVNLGNPAEVSIGELAAIILDLCGSRSGIEFGPRPPGDPERRRPDIDRAKEIIGWEPQVGIREGLSATIEWARHELSREGPHPQDRSSEG